MNMWTALCAAGGHPVDNPAVVNRNPVRRCLHGDKVELFPYEYTSYPQTLHSPSRVKTWGNHGSPQDLGLSNTSTVL